MTRQTFDQEKQCAARDEDSDLLASMSVNEAIDGPKPLDGGARARMEPLFGEDFSEVRVHANSEQARTRGAQAFTEGQDLHFAPGQFQPQSPDGDFLLGHELAHVVQQRQGGRTAQAKLETDSDVGSTLEREADRAGARAARGEQIGQLEGRAPGGAPQFFSGEEHKRMGDAATGNEELKELSSEDGSLTFGDMVLLAGDMYRSPDQIRQLARTKEGMEELRWAIWYSRDRKARGPEPQIPEATKKRVLDQYYQLAGKNVSHFSHGGTADQSYRGLHENACVLAYSSEYEQDMGLWNQAITEEAFSQHHLSDMFSAGHVRTPRADIIKDETRQSVPSGDRIVQHLASRIMHYLLKQGDLPSYARVPGIDGMVIDSIASEVKGLAGAAVDQASLAGILSMAQHDADNKGLNVVSQRDETGNKRRKEWTAHGDGQVVQGKEIVDPKTFNMTVAAMKVSRAELDMAARLGAQHRKDGTDLFYDRGDAPEVIATSIGAGRAEEFIPDVGEGNKELDWRQQEDGSWEPNMAKAIDDVFNEEFIPMIRGMVSEDYVKEVGDKKLHIGKAVRRVAQEIADSPPHKWLQEALEEVPVSGPIPEPAGVPPVYEGPPDAGVGGG